MRKMFSFLDSKTKPSTDFRQPSAAKHFACRRQVMCAVKPTALNMFSHQESLLIHSPTQPKTADKYKNELPTGLLVWLLLSRKKGTWKRSCLAQKTDTNETSTQTCCGSSSRFKSKGSSVGVINKSNSIWRMKKHLDSLIYYRAALC